MKILIAPDKFKGSLPSADVANAIAAGILKELPNCTIIKHPLADGGDGTLEAFGGANMRSAVTGPAGTKVEAAWILDEDNKRAIIESAAASGLVLVGGKETNDPVKATSAGTGELIVQAVSRGVNHIVIGIGGSAMTDGGLGCLQALEGLELSGITIRVASDVDTLFEDAAKVFGPQKGATPEQVEMLTERLTKLRAIYLEQTGIDVGDKPGSGAAGGLGGALMAIGATFEHGFDLIAQETGFYKAAQEADLIITGEGHIDETTFMGKVPGSVLEIAKQYGKPVIVVAGGIEQAIADAHPGPPYYSITDTYGFDYAYTHTEEALEGLAAKIAREDALFEAARETN